jgi:hypothetical protein
MKELQQVKMIASAYARMERLETIESGQHGRPHDVVGKTARA